MGVPCMKLRTTTQVPDTVTIGTNDLLGSDPSALAPATEQVDAAAWKHGGLGAGGVAGRGGGEAGSGTQSRYSHRTLTKGRVGRVALLSIRCETLN